MPQPIRGQGGYLVFPIGPKKKNLEEDVEILHPVKFRWIPFSGFRGEVENVSANQRPGRTSCFSDWPEKKTWKRTLKSCFLSSFVEFLSVVSEENSKCEKLTTDDGQSVITIVHLSLRLGCTKTRGPNGRISCTCVQCATFLTHVPPLTHGGHLGFSISPKKKHKLSRDLASCQFSLNSVRCCDWRCRKCLSHSEAGAAILSFRSDLHENHKLGRGRWDLASCQDSFNSVKRSWDLASCQDSLNSVQRFQRRSRKCLSQWEARVAILFFPSARKTQTW